MDTAQMDTRLEVDDLEFIPAHLYASIHGCGTVITSMGTEMRTEMNKHTDQCTWMEPTA